MNEAIEWFIVLFIIIGIVWFMDYIFKKFKGGNDGTMQS